MQDIERVLRVELRSIGPGNLADMCNQIPTGTLQWIRVPIQAVAAVKTRSQPLASIKAIARLIPRLPATLIPVNAGKRRLGHGRVPTL